MTNLDFVGGPVTATYNSGADKVTVTVRGVEYGTGAPATLPANILYVEQDAGPPVTQRAFHLGTPGGNVKIADLNPNIISGTGAQRGAVPGPNVPPDALFVVTDSSTYQPGIYQNQGGAWATVFISGAVTRTKEWRISGVATVGAKDWFWTPMRPGTIQEVQVTSQKVVNGQPLIIDLQKNGTTFDAINRATIPVNGTTSPSSVPVGATFVVGDKIQPVISQIGVQPAAVPTFKETGVLGNATATSISIPRLPTAATGDFVVLAITVASDVTTVLPPAGAGWTLRNTGGTVYASGTGRMWVFTRVDDGAAGPWSFSLVLTSDGTTASSVTRSMAQYSFTNVHATPIVDTPVFSFNNSFDTNPNLPALTTTVANELELVFVKPTSSISFSPGPVDNGYAVLQSGAFWAATITRASAGAAATGTWTGSANFTSANMRMAIQGAGAPGVWSPGEDVTVQARWIES